jgi:hypothetical protein
LLAVKIILFRFNKVKLAHLVARRSSPLQTQKGKQRLEESNDENNFRYQKKAKRTNDRWKATMTPQR